MYRFSSSVGAMSGYGSRCFRSSLKIRDRLLRNSAVEIEGDICVVGKQGLDLLVVVEKSEFILPSNLVKIRKLFLRETILKVGH